MPSRQEKLKFRTWGGARPNAGRKPSGRNHTPHRPRAEHDKAHPVHVTLRAAPRVPSLRKEVAFSALRRAIGDTARAWFRIVHFSVQSDHVHLLVEANDANSLSAGLRGVTIRLARAVNRATGRRGKVWGDRYHARALACPREVRNALVYVLMNWKKHLGRAAGIDPCSSAEWFDGWNGKKPDMRPRPPLDAQPVETPSTWLLRTGWKRHGLLHVHEKPKGVPPGAIP